MATMPHDFGLQNCLQIMRPALEVEIELKIGSTAYVEAAGRSARLSFDLVDCRAHPDIRVTQNTSMLRGF
jgi:hypothetical protein